MINDSNYDADLVHATLAVAVHSGLTSVPGDLAALLMPWVQKDRRSFRRPYTEFDALVEHLPLDRQGARVHLVEMLRHAQHRDELDAAMLGVIAPGGEAAARKRDRENLALGHLSQAEYDRRWGGINIEG